MVIEWDKILLGIAAIVTASSGIIAAIRTNQTYKGQKETAKTSEVAQFDAATANKQLIEKFDDLATEVRSNRIEVQNAKTHNDGELRSFQTEQGSMITKLTLLETALITVVSDITALKKQIKPKKEPNVRQKSPNMHP